MKRACLTSVIALTIATNARADAPVESGAVLTALQDELARTSTMQLNGMQKPYYAVLEAGDMDYLRVSASLGAIVNDDLSHRRALDSKVRVGDYTNDSGNFEGSAPWRQGREAHRQTAVEDRYDGVRHDAWLSLDASYKTALDNFAKKSAIRAGQQTPPEHVDDFSREPPVTLLEAKGPPSLDRAKATKLARAASAVAAESPALLSSTSIQQISMRRYLLSTEGTRVVEPVFNAMVTTFVRARASDGMELSTFRSVATCSADTLPSEEAIVAEARLAAKELEEIRNAPVVDDYSGPILFESVAAAQLLYDVMAYSLSGTPPALTDRSYGADPESELASLVGERVLPAGFRLEDNPTIDRLGSLPLAGCYKVDDEGVAAQKVTLVEDGVFKAFLMSRTPRKGFPHSNGHGRDTYSGVGGAIGNLDLSSARGLAAKDLRARLIAEAKSRKKPYALIVERLATREIYDPDVSRSELYGRFRDRGKKALVVWKLALDGTTTRVRGGELGAVRLRALKDILAAGNTPSVYSYSGNGGWSVTAPALLLKDVEIKKPRDPSKRPPVLPRP